MLVLHIVISIAILVLVVSKQIKTSQEIGSNIERYGETSIMGAELEYKDNQISVVDVESRMDELKEEENSILQQIRDLESIGDREDASRIMDDLRQRLDSVKSELKELCEKTPSRPLRGLFREVVSDVNGYLKKNASSVADFQLMKDIVNRKCEAKEEEIATQLPFPLYYGLAGTMAGVIVSLIFLLMGMKGGLTVQNVNPLLVGVAIAIVGSVVGLVLTTMQSNKFKSVQSSVSKNKDGFLNWIQTELLPKVGTSMSDSLERMTNNLADFNNTFSGNTDKLNQILGNVHNSYREQTELMREINKMKLDRIASANAEIYDKLKRCTDEIGQLGTYLQGLEGYIRIQQENNEILSDTLRQWDAEIEKRKGFINKVFGDVDSTLQGVAGELKDSLRQQFAQLIATMGQLQIDLQNAIKEQQEELQKEILAQQAKLQETLQTVPTEIKQIVEQLKLIPSQVDRMVEASNAQKEKIDAMSKKMEALANAIQSSNDSQNKKIDSLAKLAEMTQSGGDNRTIWQMPMYMKVSLWVLGSLLAVYCVSELITFFTSLVAKFAS